MKLLYVLIFALLVTTGVLSAQEATMTPDECREAAQAWYDALDRPLYRLAFSEVMSSSARTSRRYDALVRMRDIYADIARMNYPSCVARARNWMVAAADQYVELATAALDNIPPPTNVSLTRAALLVGQFRGYLLALDVTLREVPYNETAFFL